jgi:PhnB protein
MPNIAAYLSFDGTCDEAFSAYAEILGGEVVARMTYGASPMKDQLPEEYGYKMMHAELHFAGKSLMGADSTPMMPHVPMQGSAVAVSLATAEAAHTVFEALSKGGVIRMPIQETFWTKAFGMLTDRYGVTWYVGADMDH